MNGGVAVGRRVGVTVGVRVGGGVGVNVGLTVGVTTGVRGDAGAKVVRYRPTVNRMTANASSTNATRSQRLADLKASRRIA